MRSPEDQICGHTKGRLSARAKDRRVFATNSFLAAPDRVSGRMLLPGLDCFLSPDVKPHLHRWLRYVVCTKSAFTVGISRF